MKIMGTVSYHCQYRPLCWVMTLLFSDHNALQMCIYWSFNPPWSIFCKRTFVNPVKSIKGTSFSNGVLSAVLDIHTQPSGLCLENTLPELVFRAKQFKPVTWPCSTRVDIITDSPPDGTGGLQPAATRSSVDAGSSRLLQLRTEV